MVSEFPNIKITTKNCITEISVNGFQLPCVTGINASWDTTGALATIHVSMLGNIEVDAESKLLLRVKDVKNII
ncbi:MAG: hypothetical protein PHH48_06360 [Eubacteriales bacterium]|nr:hypothetical protein [Eubacteriales bacterium]